MTYKLEPGLSRIISPIKLHLPGGEIKEFENGTEACAAVFDHKYVIREIRAVENVVEVKLEEMKMPMNGDETFF